MEERAESWDDQQSDRFTLIVMTVGGLIFGAIFGAFILPMLYGFAASIFEFDHRLPHLRLICALVGAGVGGARSFLRGLKQVRRRRATRGVATSLGMEYAANASDELRDELAILFGDEGSISITNAVHRNIESARFVVADMRYRNSSGSNSSSNATHQTIAYFSSDQLHFPSFELQPEGMMLNLLTNVLGVQDIDFEDYPEFSSQYHLSGAKPKRIRQLFNADLLRHFTRHSGWQVKAAGNRLLLFRPRTSFSPSQLESFINDAMETFSLFMAASCDLADSRGASPDSIVGVETSSEEDAEVSDLLASLAARTKVTPDELERFLAAPAPRAIPPNILRQKLGGGSFVAAGFGCVFLGVGIILASVAGFAMPGPMDEDRIVFSILGTVFPLVGATMAFFAIRYRRRNYRLMRYGIVAEGRIEAVTRTDTTINNQRQYRLKVRFSDQLGRRTSTCNIYGKIAEEARRRHQEQLPVRVLYDRQAPQKFLWADAFALAKI